MTLETTIITRVREISPQITVSAGRITAIPDDVTCGIYLDEDDRLKIDFVGAYFNEAADLAIPVIDAFFSTAIDLEGTPDRARVAYAHGQIIRGEMEEPIGYRCVFDQEVVTAQAPTAPAAAAKSAIMEVA